MQCSVLPIAGSLFSIDRGQFLHRVTTTFEAQANSELRDEEFRFESPRD